MKHIMGNRILGLCRQERVEQTSQKGAINAIFSTFRKRNYKESTPIDILQTFKMLKSTLMRGVKSDKENEQQIVEIAGYWKQFELEDLYNNTDVTSTKQINYYRAWILTARVLNKLKQFCKMIKWKRSLKHECFKGIEVIGKYIEEKEIQYHPGKQMWARQEPKFSWHSYSSRKNFSNQYKDKEKVNYNEKIFQLAQEHKIEFILEFFTFLAKIGVIELEEVKPLFENKFMERLENISKKDQRQMFIMSYACKDFEDFENLFKEEKVEELGNGMSEFLPNYFFYKNAKRIRRKTMMLEELHAKFDDYNFLESVHDYIQWMFPNHYGSAFNSSSAALNYIQSQFFLRDQDVKTSLLYSIFLFADFMGLKIDLETLDFSIISKKRLRDVILINYHNHLRIMRIFACLSVVGFRAIALKMIRFLDQNTRNGAMLSKERDEFQKSWGIYGEQDEKTAKDMCFLEYETFPDDNGYLSKFTSKAKEIAQQMNIDKSKKKNEEIVSLKPKVEKEKNQKMEEESKKEDRMIDEKPNVEDFE